MDPRYFKILKETLVKAKNEHQLIAYSIYCLIGGFKEYIMGYLARNALKSLFGINCFFIKGEILRSAALFTPCGGMDAFVVLFPLTKSGEREGAFKHAMYSFPFFLIKVVKSAIL